jgi:oligopeptidase B
MPPPPLPAWLVGGAGGSSGAATTTPAATRQQQRHAALVVLAACSVATSAVLACYAVATTMQQNQQRSSAPFFPSFPGAFAHARRLLGRANFHRALPSRESRRAAALLARSEHTRHLLAGWPAAGVKDKDKAALVARAAEKVAASRAKAEQAAADELEAERLALLAVPTARRDETFKVASPHEGLPPRPDPYGWMRSDDRDDPAVLAHLAAENNFTRAALADTEPLQKLLYREMRSRILEADSDVPVRVNGYWRYSFAKQGDQYRTYVRVKVPSEGSPAAPPPADEKDAPPTDLPVEVLLDENKRRAQVKAEFYSMSGLTVSPDAKLVAWAEDVEGGERYNVIVAEAATGRVLDDKLAGLRLPVRGTSGDLAWAADSRTLVYVVKDGMDRPYKVLRRKYALGKEEEAALVRELEQAREAEKKENAAAAKKGAAKEEADEAEDDTNGDALVFVEPDEAYYVGLGITSSEKFLLISSGSAVTSETLVLPRDAPAAEPLVFMPRTPDVEYGLDHHSGLAGKVVAGGGDKDAQGAGWWVWTHRDALRPNSELRAAPDGAERRAGALVREGGGDGAASGSRPGSALSGRSGATGGGGGSAPASRAASPLPGGASKDKKDGKAASAAPAPPSPGREVVVLLPHRRDVKLEGFDISGRYVALFERAGANQRAVIHDLLGPSVPASAPPTTPVPLPTAAQHKRPSKSKDAASATSGPLSTGGRVLTFDEPAYSLGGSLTGDFGTPVLRMSYESLRTPASVIDEHLPSGRRHVRKVAPVLNHFDKDDYVTERVFVQSRSEADKASNSSGVQVPVAIVYRRDLFKRDGQSPMLLYGYGSYEASMDPWFSSARLSLLDRGVAFALAQVRGGGDVGREWYEDGKLTKKRNTFEDFVSVADWLQREGYTSGDRLAIEGRSAGGLLVGAALNMAPRPGFFRAALAGVGFLDALNTMLDPTLPLTVIEYEEWGNPTADKEAYEYIQSYSPYDNVSVDKEREAAATAAGAFYPHILATAGLRDPRVSYWEPAKWVAAIRHARAEADSGAASSPRLLGGAPPALPPMTLLKTDMGAGHFSVTGRFARLKETALEYAFLLKALGRARAVPLKGTGPDAPGVVPADE